MPPRRRITSFNHGGHNVEGQVLAAREDRQRRLQGQTLTRLTGGLPFDLQEQIGDEVRVRRAGERIARFGQRQMRVPFVQAEGEQPRPLEQRLGEAIDERMGRAPRRGWAGRLMRGLRQDISERGLMNRFGTPLR